ncbi:hypothetical protein HXA35_20595 [Bacillus sp. A301a_S52]|nr:hypothetical protein [Bacillus sp. A301a_S52]
MHHYRCYVEAKGESIPVYISSQKELNNKEIGEKAIQTFIESAKKHDQSFVASELVPLGFERV